MPTLTRLVGTTPVDLVADLSLTIDRAYYLQVVPGSASAVRLFEGGASAPADESYFFSVAPGSGFGLRPEIGNPIWTWTPRDDARVVLSELLP